MNPQETEIPVNAHVPNTGGNFDNDIPQFRSQGSTSGRGRGASNNIVRGGREGNVRRPTGNRNATGSRIQGGLNQHVNIMPEGIPGHQVPNIDNNNQPNGGLNYVLFDEEVNNNVPLENGEGEDLPIPVHEQNDNPVEPIDNFGDTKFPSANDFLLYGEDLLSSWNGSGDPNKGKIRPVNPEQLKYGMILIVPRFRTPLISTPLRFENLISNQPVLYSNMSNDEAAQQAILQRVFNGANKVPDPTKWPEILDFPNQVILLDKFQESYLMILTEQG